MIELFMRCRYSLVVKQILGKDQRTVQFCLSAPLVNLFELFELNIQILVNVIGTFLYPLVILLHLAKYLGG